MMPPEVRAKLAKRRGTARQRKLALDFQAPLTFPDRPRHPRKIDHDGACLICGAWQGENCRDVFSSAQQRS